MKATHVALFASLGMLLTSVSVYSLTPPGGVHATATENEQPSTPETAKTTNEATAELGRFTAGSTLMVEGRVGHPKIAARSGETFLLLEVTGTTERAKTTAPVNLALVIDRSGSMKGTRIANAIRAATSAVDRLHEGDVVSVVTFDTQVKVVVQPTAIEGGSRDRVNEDIRRITLGGDTCISCGIEQGIDLLGRTTGKVNRMILLSDGDANHGVRDLPGFRTMAQRAQSRGIAVATIGVDVEYNEKVLAAIAQDSNGRHYFVENDEGLARVFEQEAESLTSTVASEAEATIELQPGVELDRVLDRSFRRVNGKIVVPLGSFARGEAQSILMKVRVTQPAAGALAIANVDLAYKDLVGKSDGRCAGKLAVEVVANAKDASEIDPVVQTRMQRSETAQTLQDANRLFEQGRGDEARKKLAAQTTSLRNAAKAVGRSSPAPRRKAIDQDFDRQLEAVSRAESGFAKAPEAAPQPASGFATPPGAKPAAPAPAQESRAGKSQVRDNQQRAVDLLR